MIWSQTLALGHRVVKEAGGYAEFQKAFPEIVKKHGWAHNGAPGWRSMIIYDTNAGREKHMQAVKHRPYGFRMLKNPQPMKTLG